MIRILCYGDSNTWGYIPGSNHLRYDESIRWTKLLQHNLGNKFEVIEEGLNSRLLFSEDKRTGKAGRNGFKYFKPCLETHDKVDFIILMLGTNDLKHHLNYSAEQIVKKLVKYYCYIQSYRSIIDNSTPHLIALGLPNINESTDYCREDFKYVGASLKAIAVNNLLANYCKVKSITFIDNSDLATGPDGVHLTAESHKNLSIKIYRLLIHLK